MQQYSSIYSYRLLFTCRPPRTAQMLAAAGPKIGLRPRPLQRYGQSNYTLY